MDDRIVRDWQQAADDLGIRVTAPAELTDASGRTFACEALIHDFGSERGGIVVSRKTERRIRPHLRDLGDMFVSGTARRRVAYNKNDFIDALLDWGWFGEKGAEPEWFVARSDR